jgi:hypothetical protein
MLHKNTLFNVFDDSDNDSFQVVSTIHCLSFLDASMLCWLIETKILNKNEFRGNLCIIN